MWDFFDLARDLRNEMCLRVQNALQEFLELRLLRLGFNLKNLLKDSSILEYPE